MSVYSKRTVVVPEPEWEPALERLRREKFPRCSRSAMLRYLIARGLDASREGKGKEKE